MASPHPGYKIGTPYKRTGRLWSLGWHTGDDWLTPTGTKALAMADGVVRAVSYTSAYGNQVIIESTVAGRKVRHSSNHLSRAKVKTGQNVKAGQVIGYTGATGNVTGPHDHVEARVAPYSFAAANFIDPQAVYDWKPAKKRPAWAIRRPKKAPPKWFRIVGQNLGGMNDHGRATYKTRYPKIITDLLELRPSVVCYQELANPQVAYMDGLMIKAGYKRVAGSDGRYIYVLERLAVPHAGVFDLKPRYQGDDKQAAWAVVAIPGGDAFVTSGHLEHENGADQIRVDQAKSQIDQAETMALALGLSRSRIVHVTDTNSETWVRERAFNDRHYVDAAESAWRYTGLALATFKGWNKKLPKGARIDMINVHRARPVLFYGTRQRHAGTERDHLMTVADIAAIRS